MYPIIFQYKILNIGTYGIMLGIAFYLGFLLAEREMKLRGKNPDIAYWMLLASIPSAIIGAKLFHIFENFNDFLQNPTGMVFSGDGLSVYGGLLMALLVCYFVAKYIKQNYLEILDIAAPTLALGYAIGRFGCHISGDGCYGIVTSSILGTPYPNGIVPTSSYVLPTPLIESLFSFLVLILLLQLRKKELKTGTLFCIYILLNGIARFSIEFIRLNPKFALGMTQAQIIAIGLMIAGIAGWFYINRKKNTSAA